MTLQYELNLFVNDKTLKLNCILDPETDLVYIKATSEFMFDFAKFLTDNGISAEFSGQ